MRRALEEGPADGGLCLALPLRLGRRHLWVLLCITLAPAVFLGLRPEQAVESLE